MRRPRGGGRPSFLHEGEEIAVGSTAHGVLVARATSAKARRLYMGDARSQVLGRFMPFALMVLRFKLFPS